MDQVFPVCRCYAIKLMNKGEHPYAKKGERRKKRNQRKPNYVVRDSSEMLYISRLYKWSMDRELSGSTPRVVGFQRREVSAPPGNRL